VFGPSAQSAHLDGGASHGALAIALHAIATSRSPPRGLRMVIAKRAAHRLLWCRWGSSHPRAGAVDAIPAEYLFVFIALLDFRRRNRLRKGQRQCVAVVGASLGRAFACSPCFPAPTDCSG
jgi:hypothetical protein